MDSYHQLQQLLDSVVTDIADRQRLVEAMSAVGADISGIHVTPTNTSETAEPKHGADDLETQPSAPISNSSAQNRSSGCCPTVSESTAQIQGAEVDLGRAVRCGFPEVVYGEGKPPELVVNVFRTQQAAGQPSLATRVSPEQAVAVQNAFPDAIYHSAARTIRRSAETQQNQQHAQTIGQVAVVTAGSCDLPVAAEAIETLAWMDVPATLIEDVGVAGPQRLLKHVPELQKMKCIVCVAGMEAALPSVLAGHVNCPVIGVPTSIGYGASFMGVAALLSMLNCCASNVVTVNIDGGFRGGYVAGMIATGQNRHP